MFTDLLGVSTCSFQPYTKPCPEQRNVHKTCSTPDSTGCCLPSHCFHISWRHKYSVCPHSNGTWLQYRPLPGPSPFTARGQQHHNLTSDHEIRQVLRQAVRRDPPRAADATRLLSRTSTAMYHNFSASKRRRSRRRTAVYQQVFACLNLLGALVTMTALCTGRGLQCGNRRSGLCANEHYGLTNAIHQFTDVNKSRRSRRPPRDRTNNKQL